MSKELKVGAFVLGSLLIFLGALVYVDQLSSVRVPYKAYFNYAGGVDPGSPVRFGGMKVGSITAIRQWSQDPTKIEILMEVKEGIPINGESVGMLTSLSPLGDKYLEITTGSNQARRLPPGSTIPTREPISLDDLARQASDLMPAVQSTLQSVQKDVERLTVNAGTALANVQSMTGPQNQRNLSLLLAKARETLDRESGQIDALVRDLDRAALQANSFMGQASGVMNQASGVMGQASGALNEMQTAARTANDTFSAANLTIGEMRNPIKSDLAEMQRAMTEARRLISNLSAVVASNEYNIDDTLDNFRAASENLRELTTSVRRRPWTLFRGKSAPDRQVPVAVSKP